jgi:F0F1-type ATP synthase membrane subunit b/b'
VAEKAVQLAEQIISKNLQAADHVRMVEGFLGKMQKEDFQKKVVRVQ